MYIIIETWPDINAAHILTDDNGVNISFGDDSLLMAIDYMAENTHEGRVVQI